MICSQVIDTARTAAVVPQTRNYGALLPDVARGNGGGVGSGSTELAAVLALPAVASHASDLTTAEGSEFKRHQRPI